MRGRAGRLVKISVAQRSPRAILGMVTWVEFPRLVAARMALDATRPDPQEREAADREYEAA